MSFLAPAIIASEAVKKSTRGNVASASNYSVYNPDLSSHGLDYQALASNNPYANVPYRQSWIQKLLEGLGFRTNKDAYLESMALQAKEYDNQILQKEYNENYDSPLEQVKREREAGLNPDLTGNVDSGSSSAMVDDGNPPIAPEADDLNMVQSFAGSTLQALQGAFAIAGNVLNLKSAVLDNRSKAISQISQEDSMMMEAMLNILPDDSTEPLNYNQLYDSFRKTYGNRIKKKYFSDFVNRAFNFQRGLSFSEKKFSKENLRASNRKGYFQISSGSDYSEVDDVMREVSGVLSDLAVQANTYSQKASISKSKNDISYEENVRPEEMANKLEREKAIDPTRMAQMEMQSQGLDIGIKQENMSLLEYKKMLRVSYKSILKKLDKLEDNGNWFAPYAKITLSTLLMKFLGD